MRMNLNHWFVKFNELSISLMRFYVSISMCLDIDESFCFTITVNDSNMDYLYLYFPSLEDAIDFTENTIAKCNSLDEIQKLYKEQYASKSK